MESQNERVEVRIALACGECSHLAVGGASVRGFGNDRDFEAMLGNMAADGFGKLLERDATHRKEHAYSELRWRVVCPWGDDDPSLLGAIPLRGRPAADLEMIGYGAVETLAEALRAHMATRHSTPQ